MDAQKVVNKVWPKPDWFVSEEKWGRKISPPSIISLFDFLCYTRCNKVWEKLKIKNEIMNVAFVPVWVCDNAESETTSNKWKIKTGFVNSEAIKVIDEIKTPILFVGQIEFVKAPCIINIKNYHESALTFFEFYCKSYGVLYSIVEAKILDVTIIKEISPEIDKPEIKVPPFTTLIRPALYKYELPTNLLKTLYRSFEESEN